MEESSWDISAFKTSHALGVSEPELVSTAFACNEEPNDARPTTYIALAICSGMFSFWNIFGYHRTEQLWVDQMTSFKWADNESQNTLALRGLTGG